MKKTKLETVSSESVLCADVIWRSRIVSMFVFLVRFIGILLSNDVAYSYVYSCEASIASGGRTLPLVRAELLPNADGSDGGQLACDYGTGQRNQDFYEPAWSCSVVASGAYDCEGIHGYAPSRVMNLHMGLRYDLDRPDADGSVRLSDSADVLMGLSANAPAPHGLLYPRRPAVFMQNGARFFVDDGKTTYERCLHFLREGSESGRFGGTGFDIERFSYWQTDVPRYRPDDIHVCIQTPSGAIAILRGKKFARERFTPDDEPVRWEPTYNWGHR